MTDPRAALEEAVSEEKAIEHWMAGDAEMQEYLAAFQEARFAYFQQPGETISQANHRCFIVLKKHFTLAAACLKAKEAGDGR